MKDKLKLTRPSTGPWWTPLALWTASVGLNLVVWGLARLLGPSSQAEFEPLSGPGSVILLTSVGAFGAFFTYWFLAQITRSPTRWYLILSIIVLILSFIPDIDYPASVPGYSSFAIIILILLHITAAFVDVGLLLWIIRWYYRK